MFFGEAVGNGLSISFNHRLYDPLQGVRSFNSLWGPIDGNAVPSIELMRGDLQKSFWDRFEFLNALDTQCSNDVYVSCTDASIRIIAINPNDHDKIHRLLSREKDYRVDLPEGQLATQDMRNWLMQHCGPKGFHTVHGHMVQGHNSTYFYIRDSSIATLFKLRYFHSEPTPVSDDNDDYVNGAG